MTVSSRRVQAALAGDLPERELRPDERAMLNAELDALIADKARSTSFGAELVTRGQTCVALDEEGELRAYRPDGTSSPLG